ncbi:MAG: hypothetical protein U9N09_10005 [Euryarchaeota archaeon]|nr:hypothetical protein [Euryarchaeota archaeon]
MQEVVTFGEILDMRHEKFVFESKKNMGDIVYALVHEIVELRKELEEIKGNKSVDVVERIVVLNDVSYSVAKSMIEDYLKSHEDVYMYELSNDLRLDLKIVHEIVEELIKEDKVE